MHILGLLLAAIGVVGMILWRLNQAAEASRNIGEAALDARGLFKRWSWQRKFAKSNLELVQDPREAAVTMMVALAQSDGAITERERRAILMQIVKRFGATGVQAEAMMAHGRWFARDAADVSRCVQKLTPLVKRSCTPEQIEDILIMVEDVAAAEGVPGAIERDAVEKLRHTLARS